MYFGSYPQSDATGQMKEPIKWRVLSVDGDDAFLIADQNLDVQKYNDTDVNVTWENCTMRSWLNGYGSSDNVCGNDYTDKNFINRAFTSEEQEAILTTDVVNVDNPEYETEGSYYDKARMRKNSNYAKKQGAVTSLDNEYFGNGGWWLRTGYNRYGYEAMNLGLLGQICGDYTEVDSNKIGVCLALYLNLSDSSLWSYAGTVSTTGEIK